MYRTSCHHRTTVSRHRVLVMWNGLNGTACGDRVSWKVDRASTVLYSDISFCAFGLSEEQFGDEQQCQLSIMHAQQSGAIDLHCDAGCRSRSSAACHIPSPLAIASSAVRRPAGQPPTLHARSLFLLNDYSLMAKIAVRNLCRRTEV